MLIRQKRLKKSEYRYSSMKVGEVVIYKAPFGERDGWLSIDAVKGYQFALGHAHRLAIRDTEKRLGFKFHVHYGDGFIRVTRIS